MKRLAGSLIVCLFAGGVAAQEQPFAVVFQNHTLDPTVRSNRILLQQQFSFKSSAQTANTGKTNPAELLSMDYRRLWAEAARKNFRIVNGRAHYFHKPTGRFTNLRFMSTPSRRAFDNYVDDLLAPRGDFRRVGTDTRFSVKTPPVQGVGNNPTLTWQDAHFAYRKGMFAFGSQEHVLNTNFEPLIPLAREARGKDWYMIVQPENASDDARRAYLKRYLPKWAVLRQRQDDEGSATYEARSKRFGLYTTALEAMVHDSESVKWAVQTARAKTGYEMTFQVVFRKRTPAALAMQAIVPRTSRLVQHPKETLVSIASNINTTPVLRDFLIAWSGIQEDSLAAIIMEQAGRAEVVNSHIHLTNDSETGRVVASGFIPWSADTSFRKVNPSIEESDFEADQITIRLPLPTETPYVITGKRQQKGTRCAFAIGQPLDTSGTRPEMGPRQRIFSAKLDLSDVAASPDNSAAARELLTLLEERYSASITDVTGPLPSFIKVAPQPFESVLPMLADEGDWTATLDIDVVNRRGLRLSLKVGRELFGLWGARKRLSKRSRARSLGDD